jgi:putative sigma-54 modulation protein
MKIDVQARDFPLTDALRRHAERRLRFTLSRNEGRIRRIEMRLSDVNGPRGGQDKRCQVRMVLGGMPELVIEDTETDLYAAINRAVSRAGRNLARRLKRRLAKGGYPRIADTLGVGELSSNAISQ